MKPRPPRIRFLEDDPAALWRKGDTGDDLGPDPSGRHLLKLDHYDDKVSIQDPYGRGIIGRLDDDTDEPSTPGFSDEELDAFLDREEPGDDPALD